MLREILGIRFAVALHIRQAAGLAGIGPKVIGIGIEVVRAALAELRGKGSDRHGRLPQCCRGGVQNAFAINRRNIERQLGLGRLCCQKRYRRRSNRAAMKPTKMRVVGWLIMKTLLCE